MSPPGFFSRQTINGQPPQAKLLPLLCLRGEKGTVACRVHVPSDAKMLPEQSSWGRLHFSLLSEEKMGNLTAVRGVPGAGMVGPADYFGTLERSDQSFMSININSAGKPTFTQYPLNQSVGGAPLQKLDPGQLSKVKAQWFSGLNKEGMLQKKKEYKNQRNPLFSESLFPNSGILEIEGSKEIRLKALDPRGIDLSEFKARLVANSEPFQITSERLHVDDEYCAVSYKYDAGYAERQVQHGGGLFLEFHQFAQTITPLHDNSTGFVTLAKWNQTHTELELIAIQIPYGYTLIIEKDCIHGDTNLNGLFMMCMTSDHISMATADTVFLKHATDKDNINITLENNLEQEMVQRAQGVSEPLFFYKENRAENFPRFKQRIQQMDIIFTPFNLGYWEVKQDMVNTVTFFVLSGASLFAAITLLDAMVILSIGLFSVSTLLAGIGLYKTLSSLLPQDDNSILATSLTF